MPQTQIKQIEKFSKANAFDYLKALALDLFSVNEDGQFTRTPSEIKDLFADEIKSNFEPQSGGGASKNPSFFSEEEQSMMHFCRFKKCFMREEYMNMFNGKSKGASTLAAKHDYELKKQILVLRDKAMKFFQNADYINGSDTIAKADLMEETRNDAETYDYENVKQWIKKKEASQLETDEDSTEVDEEESTESTGE